MNLEEQRQICMSLPHVTEDIKWDNNLCFCIGGKIFLMAALDETPAKASFKTDEVDFLTLSSKDGFNPAPYLARHNWMHTSDINSLSRKEWIKVVSKAYQLIKSKLPKKKQKELTDL